MAFGTTPVDSLEAAEYAATPTRKVRGKHWNARCRVFTFRYTAAALAKGAQIRLARIPKGHVFLDGRLHWSALGAASQLLGVGDAFDSDRFMLRANGVVASNLQFNVTPFAGDCGRFNAMDTFVPALDASGQGNATGPLYEFTCDTDIILYNSYAATLTGAIRGYIRTATE